MSKRVLTGLKPTGELTIGNYIGAILPLVKMQNDYDEMFLFVADLHALTIPQDKDLLMKRIKSFLAMYIACGIDPNKTTIYIQSENEYIPSISWLLECNTYYGEASRMIQFKEKSKGNDNFSIGLLTYPILMSADILFCDADYVPVGIDQKQHVELARDIAERFNKKYGNTFKVPEALVTKQGEKIKDLKDPTKKMSKSSDSPSGVITMYDTIEEITKKIKSATTDSDMNVKFDEDKKPGISNLLIISSSLTGKSIKELEIMFEGKNYGEFKSYVIEVVSNTLSTIQSKYNEVMNGKLLNKVLDEGISKTRKIAKEKYEIMKERIGLNIGR